MSKTLLEIRASRIVIADNHGRDRLTVATDEDGNPGSTSSTCMACRGLPFIWPAPAKRGSPPAW